MISNSKMALNHLGDTTSGPQLGSITCFLGAAGEDLDQPIPPT